MICNIESNFIFITISIIAKLTTFKNRFSTSALIASLVSSSLEIVFSEYNFKARLANYRLTSPLLHPDEVDHLH